MDGVEISFVEENSNISLICDVLYPLLWRERISYDKPHMYRRSTFTSADYMGREIYMFKTYKV